MKFDKCSLKYGLLVGLILVSRSAAQDVTSSPSHSPTGRYTENNFGFSIELPADWIIDRTRFIGLDGSIGLSHCRNREGSQSSQILIFRDSQPRDFAAWCESFTKRLLQSEGVSSVRGDPSESPSRPAFTIKVTGQSGGEQSVRRFYCVPFDANTVWVLIFASIHPDPRIHESANREFDAAVASLRVFYNAESKEAMNAALERGRGVIAELAKIGPEVRIDAEPHYYMLDSPDGPVGYLWIQHQHAVQDGKPGLRVKERGWQFSRNGTATQTRSDFFASFDGRTEQNETRITAIAPLERSNTPDRGILITLDQCIREGDSLFSSFSISDQPTRSESRLPIETGPFYLPLAWSRLFPKLIGTAATEPVGFVTYDPQIRGLVSRTIRSVGTKPDPSDGILCSAFEVREGYSPDATVLYVTDTGHVRFTGDERLKIRATTKADVDRLFGAKRSQAEQRLRPKP